jgi:hypothetical protein
LLQATSTQEIVNLKDNDPSRWPSALESPLVDSKILFG